MAIGMLHEAAAAARRKEELARRTEDDLARNRNQYNAAVREAAACKQICEELCREAGVSEPENLPAAIEAAGRKRNLIERIEGYRKALLPACSDGTLQELIQDVQRLDLDASEARRPELEKRQSELEEEKSRISRQIDDIERDFQIHEAAAAVIEAAVKKQAAAARISELTDEYLAARLSAMLLKRSVDLYRIKYQDPLLRRVGEYFSILTCGAFEKLSIDYDDAGRRILRGVRAANNARVEVEGMSDGTRDQLFLAFRLAYVESKCADLGPCPVILDDVLMAFDEKRAIAALSALSELSERTRAQVLVFTHNAHDVELAEKALGRNGFERHALEIGDKPALKPSPHVYSAAVSAAGQKNANGLFGNSPEH
jgi:uncharacterized protein YhaN